MHPAVMKFVYKTVRQHDPSGPCLELGSLNINGTVRHVFSHNQPYIGIDLHKGKDVDMIANAHNLPFRDNTFSIVVSTEMLEHDTMPVASLEEAFRVLVKKGLLICTAATDQRPEHNVYLTGYYKNIAEDTVREVLSQHATTYHIEADTDDIRFWGIKN